MASLAGVGTACHRGAIAAKGETVGMFGTGVDDIYPNENRGLVDQILSTGSAVV